MLFICSRASVRLSLMYEPQEREKKRMIIQLNSNCYYQRRIVSILALSLSFLFLCSNVIGERRDSSKMVARVWINWLIDRVMVEKKMSFILYPWFFFSMMVDWYLISTESLACRRKKKRRDSETSVHISTTLDWQRKKEKEIDVFILKLKSIQEICRQTCLERLLMHFYTCLVLSSAYFN